MATSLFLAGWVKRVYNDSLSFPWMVDLLLTKQEAEVSPLPYASFCTGSNLPHCSFLAWLGYPLRGYISGFAAPYLWLHRFHTEKEHTSRESLRCASRTSSETRGQRVAYALKTKIADPRETWTITKAPASGKFSGLSDYNESFTHDLTVTTVKMFA